MEKKRLELLHTPESFLETNMKIRNAFSRSCITGNRRTSRRGLQGIYVAKAARPRNLGRNDMLNLEAAARTKHWPVEKLSRSANISFERYCSFNPHFIRLTLLLKYSAVPDRLENFFGTVSDDVPIVVLPLASKLFFQNSR